MIANKKLIEVALPLDAINRGSEQDKNRKTGHIRNLHKWFAPMPLPAWRAMIFASLVDDPGSTLPEDEAALERDRLLAIVSRLSAFDAYEDSAVLAEARAVLKNAFGDEIPTIVDPFCGGGSTIIEAQRLGLPTRASDLNPVPVLITTILSRVAPLFSGLPPVNRKDRQGALDGWTGISGLRADIDHFAGVVREKAWEQLKDYYPPTHGGDGVPFAYRWAWTVASPDPAMRGAHTPLVTDWWLSKSRGRRAYVAPAVNDGAITFAIDDADDAPPGTTGRRGARCLLSDSSIPLEYIREQGRSGALGQLMLAVASRVGTEVRYSVPDEEQLAASRNIPDVDLPGIEMPDAALGFRVQRYGIHNFVDLFTRRQSLALTVFADCVREVHEGILQAAVANGFANDEVALEDGGSGARAYADSVCAFLGLCVSKMAQANCILVRWFIDPRSGGGKATPAFDRHAIPMVWDFVETNPFGGSVGDWTGPVLKTALRAFDLCAMDGPPVDVRQSDARDVPGGDKKLVMFATDPPYYANIGYADLSDFFYLWIRRALLPYFPSLLSTVSAPKGQELIASPHRHAGGTEQADEYFRSGFTDVFHSLARKQDPRVPMLVVYALKQGESSSGRATGWELFLRGLIDAGLSIVATWPVRTTTKTRMIGFGTNALSSAIFVVCRSRPADAGSVTRREFLDALRDELPTALSGLQRANIAPVDLEQAAIGPGMAVFTSHNEVVNADGTRMSVREALAAINAMLDETLEGDFDADTRWALTWLEEYGYEEGDGGTADQLSRAKNTSLQGLVHAGIVRSRRETVRLLKPSELDPEWEPVADSRLTIWEVTQHLTRALEAGGESSAAVIARALGHQSEEARALAYRLFTVSKNKGRAADALSYNSLVQSWPEIIRLARQQEIETVAQGALALDEA